MVKDGDEAKRQKVVKEESEPAHEDEAPTEQVGAPAPSTLPLKSLGTSSLVVSHMGYGAWPLSYDNRPPEAAAIKVLHMALDWGIRFIDTADCYCKDDSEFHHNERLIRKAIQTYSRSLADQVVVATKGIFVRPDGAWHANVSPDHLRKTIAESHEALWGSERPIDLWQMHTCPPIDGDIPFRDLLIPVREAVESGVVRFVGLSNCTVKHIKLANEVLPAGKLVSVQNRFNMFDRSAERDGTLEFCQDNGLAFLPYSALGGLKNAGGANLLQDSTDYPNVHRIATEKGCSHEALVLAYMMAKWSCIVHITSARDIAHLKDSIGSVNVKVTTDEIASLDRDGDQRISAQM